MMDVLKKFVSLRSTKKQTIARIEKNQLSIDKFQFKKTLGTGSFGRVFLAIPEIPQPHPVVAIKRLKKANLIKQKQVDHLISEKSVLCSLRHQFIVNCFGAFKDDRYLYIVMEYVRGGEFFIHLRKRKKFDNPEVRFYAAQVALVFEYLHSQHTIYRDLKPENLLVDEQGYLKLTDFGFAKVVTSRTFTLCGTPEYIAPEVLLNKGHGKPVDWWTLGVLIYEMALGYPPFFDADPMAVYQKILKGRIIFPSTFNEDCKSLVKKLLVADLSKRYGELHGGAQDIKAHRWFGNFPWSSLARKELAPPFKPVVKGMDDTSNFDNYPDSTDIPEIVVGSNDPFNNWLTGA